MRNRYYTWGAAAVLLVALVLRVSCLKSADFGPLGDDQRNYVNMAIQILEKGVYAYNDTEPNSLVTPGWPIFLTVILKITGYDPLEHTITIIRYLNVLISLGAIWFIYRIGTRLFHPMTGILASLFAAVHPSYVWSVSLILTEVPFLTLFTGLILLQVRIIQENRPRDHIWMGLLLAATVLIRPNILPIAVVPYLFLWAARRQWFLSSIIRSVSAFVLGMLPWWIRNAVTFRKFIFLGDEEAGNPFLGGTDPYMRGTIDWDAIDNSDQFNEGLRRIKQGLQDDPELWIHWFTVGKWKFINWRRWFGDYYVTVPEWYYNLLFQLHYVIVDVGWLSLVAFTLFRSRSAAYLLTTLLVVYFVHAMFIPEPRYLYGMLPFLMLGTAQAVVWTAGFIGKRIGRIERHHSSSQI